MNMCDTVGERRGQNLAARAWFLVVEVLRALLGKGEEGAWAWAE
jgi:hypothetical protein